MSEPAEPQRTASEPEAAPGTPAAVLALGPVLPVVAAVAVYFWAGLPLAILVLAFGALVGAILLVYGSLQAWGEAATLSLEEALELATPTAEEERKLTLLRALKELEAEHALGKLDAADYQRLAADYRAEARELLARTEEQLTKGLARAEKAMKARLEAEGLSGAGTASTDDAESADSTSADHASDAAATADEANDTDEPTATDDAETSDAAAESSPVDTAVDVAESAPVNVAEPVNVADAVDNTAPTPDRRCSACDTRNDGDARFCKRCGKELP